MAIADFLNQLMISLVSTIHRLSVHTDVKGRVFNGKKITPCLWFDGNAEKAVNYYISVFKNSKILEFSRYNDAAPMPSGTYLTGIFEMEGQEFMALNASLQYHFTRAISFVVDCKTQEEVVYFWDKLS